MAALVLALKVHIESLHYEFSVLDDVILGKECPFLVIKADS